MNKLKKLYEEIPDTLTKKRWRFPVHGRRQWTIFLLLLFLLVGGLVVILRVEKSYRVLESFEKTDVTGTQYQHFGRRLFKYSPDGVSCLNSSGEVVWNCTFSMQSPITDICETTAVVGDQQGTSIYIFDEDGQIGQFDTLLPIA